jgi:hypothetical protein
MAELSSTGPVVPFARESYWNNFNFGPASKLERKARLDIGSRGPRDVYLYVTTNNMPATVSDDPAGDGQREGSRLPSPAVRKQIGRIVPGRVGEKEVEQLRSMVASGRLTYEDLTTVMPTYGVYVWHDTGASEASPLGPSKLLQAQPSFTLLVSHDGPLVGWKHSLSGVGGVALTEIAPNFYKIAVGPSGTVEVMTTVEAIEREEPKQAEPAVDPTPPPPSPVTPWWLWVLVCVLIAVMLAFLLRKRP